jgi:methylmalonyl-CoA mutase C-terminal domain/subunit
LNDFNEQIQMTTKASAQRPVRILIAKAGLDGHDRGAKVIARALRDAGMEVIYTGLHQTTEAIVRAAIQEDVDCIGLSILSGAHMTLFPDLLEKLKKEGAQDISVFGGGIIPKDDIVILKSLGVKEVFIPGTHTQDVIAWIRSNIPVHD